MTQIAERNRAIKATLEKAFGRGKVRVKGSRGTAYGWVSIYMNWTPLDIEQRQEMQTQVWALLRAAGLKEQIGTYGYNDPGSDYGFGSKCNIYFNACRYFLTMKHPDGTMSAIRDYHDGNWELVA